VVDHCASLDGRCLNSYHECYRHSLIAIGHAAGVSIVSPEEQPTELLHPMQEAPRAVLRGGTMDGPEAALGLGFAQPKEAASVAVLPSRALGPAGPSPA